MKILKILFPLALCLSLLSCKSKKEDDSVIPLRQSYDKGLAFMEKSKYEDAAEEFGKIFLQHPGNELTPGAELMQAYALFLARKYEESIDVLDIFISLHPTNPDIAYAYYLKGLDYYDQINPPNLDQSKTFLAKEAFEELMKRFPDTKYSIDASLKIDLINDHLAGYENYVGRYYAEKSDPIAAINRFKKVVTLYPTTSHIEESLYRLTASYLALGLKSEAEKYASILGYNYPESSWYKKAYDLLGVQIKKIEKETLKVAKSKKKAKKNKKVRKKRSPIAR